MSLSQECNDGIYAFYSAISPKPIEWLWHPYIPCGKLTLLIGDPGDGKSTFMLHVAALLTQGAAMPDGYPVPKPQNVIYQCAEDDIADTIKPRLIRAGADCSRIAYIVNENGDLHLGDSRIHDVIAVTNARLVILDPLQSFLIQNRDMVDIGRIRALLGQLAITAAKYKCAIVLVGHMNKTVGSRSLYRGLGSIDIPAIARSVMMIVRTQDGNPIRHVCHVKSSLAPEGKTLRFVFNKAGCIQWLTPCSLTHNDIAASELLQDPKRSRAADAMIEALCNGSARSLDVLSLLERQGFSQRTIYTAKKDIGIISYKEKSTWYWKLPHDMREMTEGESP